MVLGIETMVTFAEEEGEVMEKRYKEASGLFLDLDLGVLIQVSGFPL